MVKLSVVKASNGDYLVNYHYKISDTRITNFEGVIKQLEIYKPKVEIFKEEPTLTGLSEDEEKKILDFRKKVLEEELLGGEK